MYRNLILSLVTMATMNFPLEMTLAADPKDGEAAYSQEALVNRFGVIKTLLYEDYVPRIKPCFASEIRSMNASYEFVENVAQYAFYLIGKDLTPTESLARNFKQNDCADSMQALKDTDRNPMAGVLWARWQLAVASLDTSGERVEKYKLVFPVLRDAYARGESLAALPLAFMYENGFGTQKNLSEAARIYRSAVDQKISYAEIAYAEFLIRNFPLKGVSKDVLPLLEQGMKNGLPEAFQIIFELKVKGVNVSSISHSTNMMLQRLEMDLRERMRRWSLR